MLSRFSFGAAVCLFTALPLVAQLSGHVVHGETQAPIEGALVRIHQSQMSTTTDANGAFVLNDSAPGTFRLMAAKHGFYNGHILLDGSVSTDLVIQVAPISTEFIADAPLNAPARCNDCHPDQVSQWTGSPMQKTGLNTWVFDIYDGTGTPGGMNGFVYKRDSVHRETQPNSDCSACHSPVHWLADIENNGMGNFHEPNEDMMNGVQCEVCHRVYDVDIDQTYMPGVQPESFQLLRNYEALEFGPFGDVFYEQQVMRAAYNPQLKAQLCSACHEDNVDHDGDGEFNDPGSLPHESTFTEWRNWQALSGEHEEACVDCHMPATNADAFCIFIKGREPGTIKSHDIRGTTPEFLENALSLNTDIREGIGDLTVDIRLTNDKAGHAVPTGVVVRNVILLVIARDGNGNRLSLLEGDLVDDVGGVGDFDSGDYAGHPGMAFYRNMSDGVDERLFYTEAQEIVSDTRIQPGTSYAGSFRFDTLGVENVSVDVKVLYRRAFREFVLIKGWTTTGHGETLADIEAPHYGHVMNRHQEDTEVCQARDFDTSGGIDITDLQILAEQWREPAPFGGGTTSILHLVSMTECFP